MNVNPKKIQIVYLGVEEIFFEKKSKEKIKQTLNKHNLDKKYILFVGTIEPRKNISALIGAFAKLQRRELELVICGKLGWMYDNLFSVIKKEEISEQVKLLGFVPDEDLPSLYAGAEMFVYPSFYEGFGLPVVEAMASGCPVITSDLSSTKEIAGEAAVLINPNSEDELTNAIKTMLKNNRLRERIVKNGIERAEEFTALRTAKNTLQMYLKIKL